MGDKFCEKCGCYLKDSDTVCPECGKPTGVPYSETVVSTNLKYAPPVNGVPLDAIKDLFGKYFYASLIIMCVASFAVTYFWRFSFLLFIFPLLMPSRKGISLGLMIGTIIGSISGWLLRSGFFLI